MAATLTLDGDAVLLRLNAPEAIGGDVTVEFHGQSRRGVLPTLRLKGRLASSQELELRVPLTDLSVPLDVPAAQIGAIVRTTFDDGVSDTEVVSSIYLQRGAERWDVVAPAVDETTIVQTDLVLPSEASVAMKLPLTRAQILERARALGLNPSDSTLTPNASDVPAMKGGAGQVAALAGSLTVNFCLNQRSTFWDGGQGEDYWPQTSATYRPPLGIVSQVYDDDWDFSSVQYLNPSGCTGNLSIDPDTYFVKVWSTGTMAPSDNQVDVRPCVDGNGSVPVDDCNGASTLPSWIVSFGSITGPGTKTANYDPSTADDEFGIAALGLFALWRNPGTTSGVVYNVRARAFRSANGNPIVIRETDGHRKWLIGHEFGHRFFDLNAPNVPWSGGMNDVTVDDNDPDCFSTDADHNVKSKEWVGSAFTESIASFYGALTFNSGGVNADCFFEGPGLRERANGTAAPLHGDDVPGYRRRRAHAEPRRRDRLAAAVLGTCGPAAATGCP